MPAAAAAIGRSVRAVFEIVGAFAGLFVAAALIGALIVPLLPPRLATPVMGLGLWGAVAAGWALLRLSKRSYGDLGFKRPASWLKTLGWAVLAALVSNLGAFAIGALISTNLNWPPLDTSYIRASIEGDVAAYVMWMVLVVWGSAAFGEELFARGFVLDRLHAVFGNGRIGLVIAVLGQAALFGALHAVQGPTGIVITAYVGLVFAIVYYASGRNLWAPILAHGLMDSVGLTLMFLAMPLPGHIQ